MGFISSAKNQVSRFGVPKGLHLSAIARQSAAATAAIALYGVAALAMKWWLYPGWTWRGYLTDAKAVGGLVVFALGFALWLFQVYRRKTLAEASSRQIRSLLESERLPLITAVLGVSTLGLLAALLIFGEREVATTAMDFARQSQWQSARSSLTQLFKAPIRQDLLESFDIYVAIHEASERDQLRDSRSLRESRSHITRLLASGHDYESINSLSFAEISKNVYFVERAAGGTRPIDEGIQQLSQRVRVVRSESERARLLLRVGELQLATKNYQAAQFSFEQVLRLHAHPTLLARARASLGNALVSDGNLVRAIELYKQAEADYPEGRLNVFYSNWGYLLMLSKQYGFAKERIERALQIDPTDWYSYLNLGLVKERLREYEDAYKDFMIVVGNSLNPDSKREARILAGRCLEIGGHERSEYLQFYLEADSRSATSAQIARILADRTSLAAVYSKMAELLQSTNTHGIEEYVEWFNSRARQIALQ